MIYHNMPSAVAVPLDVVVLVAVLYSHFSCYYSSWMLSLLRITATANVIAESWPVLDRRHRLVDPMSNGVKGASQALLLLLQVQSNVDTELVRRGRLAAAVVWIDCRDDIVDVPSRVMLQCLALN
jgi:hypothetical protein